jgi:glycosyltransferase involved in cell wall biosynthesis
MNILYLDATRGLYGASRMLLTLLEHIDRDTFRPYVVLANDIDDGDLRLVEALRRNRVPTREYGLAVLRRARYLNPRGILQMGAALVRSVPYLVRVVHKYRIDVVQTNTGTILSGALAARAAGVPHIWHIHEIFRPADARIFPPLLEVLSTCVVGASNAVGESLAGYRPSIVPKLTVIRNGIDPAPFREADPQRVAGLRREFGIEPGDKIVGMVGRIGTWKGEHGFLEVAEQVSTRVPEARFLVVGGTFDNRDRYLDNVRDRAAHNGLGEKVIVTGFRTDIQDILHLFDVMLHMPDRPEPFGLVAAEAMAAGKPVVAAGQGGLTEIVCDWETGYLVPPGDTEAATNRVVELLTNDRLRNHMGRAGRRRVEREFPATRYAREFESLYREVAGTRKT